MINKKLLIHFSDHKTLETKESREKRDGSAPDDATGSKRNEATRRVGFFISSVFEMAINYRERHDLFLGQTPIGRAQ